MDDKYDRGGDFTDNLISDATLEFSHRWLGLGSFSDVLNDIDEYYKHKNSLCSNVSYRELSNGHSPIVPILNNGWNPIVFNNMEYEPELYTPPYPENVSYESLYMERNKKND